MRPRLGSLAFAMASLFLKLRALEKEMPLGLLPRSLDFSDPFKFPDSQQRAICVYTPSNVESIKDKMYAISIDLPGAFWKSVCAEPDIMGRILGTIELRCLRIWSQKGSRRSFGSTLDAGLDEGQCRIGVTVVAESEEDPAFPRFEDDCILHPKPEPCGLAAKYFPWPSTCDPVNVRLRPECCLLFYATSVMSIQLTLGL